MVRQQLLVFWECYFSCLFSAAASQSRERGNPQGKHLSKLSAVYRSETALSVWNKEVVITGLHGGNARINKESAPPSKKSAGLALRGHRSQLFLVLWGFCEEYAAASFCEEYAAALTLRSQSNGDSHNWPEKGSMGHCGWDGHKG